MTYLERLQTDPELRAFVEAEVARAVVDRDALKAHCEQLEAVIRSLQASKRSLEQAHEELQRAFRDGVPAPRRSKSRPQPSVVPLPEAS